MAKNHLSDGLRFGRSSILINDQENNKIKSW